MLHPRTLLLVLACSLTGSSAFSVGPEKAADPKQIAFFESKIRPVLVEHCYSCHSAEAKTKKKLRGGLYLDTRKGLLDGGDSGPAIVPGKAADSLLLKTMRYTGDVKMPPKQKLPDAVLADFETWINRGAADPRGGTTIAKQRGLSIEEGRRFWAYQAPRMPAIPQVNRPDRTGNDIDAFILARIEAQGHQPAPLADRAVLVRRLYFDLVGLPPTPAEVEAFVRDTRPDAYERLVERLLGSPQFGQRWGRHWLDVARFADSVTLRGFVLPQAWRYRDLVIDAFNEDLPFDWFVRAQVAGDLLPSSSLEQKRRQLIATTFLTMGNANLENQDKKQLDMDVVDEQLETLGRGFLAQTITCARCHDHKFDPVPTRDYHALAGILRNVRTLEHSNVSKWLEMPLPGQKGREKEIEAHDRAVAALEKEVQSLRAALGKKGAPARAGRGKPRKSADLAGIVLDDAKARKVGEWAPSTFSGNYVDAGYVHDSATGKGMKSITYQPEIPETGKYEVRLSYTAGTNRASRVPVTIFSADGEKTIHIDQRKAPDIDGMFVSLGRYTFEKTNQGFVLISNEGTTGHVIADAVQFIPADQVVARPAAAPVSKPEKGGKPAPVKAGDLRALEARLKKLRASGPPRDLFMTVVESPRIEDLRIHIRGNVHNLGEKVPRGFLQVATTGTHAPLPTTQSGRLQLAEWLTSKDNPLTARVFANRVWHWLFGSGLVRTTDNFGTTGEKPSHPELLDYLTVRFVEEGWSVKRLVRRIVLSRTYRQSASGDLRTRVADPENRLFARANRRRLDAECIRDAMLQVSGQLTTDHGGPTYRRGLSSDYGYKHTDTRRSVYAPVFRNSLPDLFEAFDFADPSVTTGRRNVSTVAPQALFLMNHPFVLDQARHAARQVLAGSDRDDRARLDRAYRLTLGRAPTDAEARLALAYLPGADGTRPDAREDAWAQVFQVLFASIDFRYVE